MFFCFTVKEAHPKVLMPGKDRRHGEFGIPIGPIDASPRCVSIYHQEFQVSKMEVLTYVSSMYIRPM